METVQKTSPLSIWIKPREAIRYYAAKRSAKLESLMIFFTSVPIAAFLTLWIPFNKLIVFSGALIGCFLSIWLSSYVYAGLYTLPAKWLKGKANYKNNRLAYLLSNAALAPFVFCWLLIRLLPLLGSLYLGIFSIAMLCVYFVGCFYVFVLQLIYASEMNQFSKMRAFIAYILALLIPYAVIFLLMPIIP